MQLAHNEIDETVDTTVSNNEPLTKEALGKMFFDGFIGRMARRYPTRYNFKNNPQYSATKLETAEAKRDRRARRNLEILERNQRNAEALKNAKTYGEVA